MITARTRTQKRLQLNVPNYINTKDQEQQPNQPTLDPLAGISNTVILDDVKILKGDLGNNVKGTLIPATIPYTHSSWVLPNCAVFEYDFTNGENNDSTLTISDNSNTDKLLKAWGTGTIVKGPVTYNNGVFTINKTGYYEVEASFGIWLGGNSSFTDGSSFYNPGIPFTYTMKFTELGSASATRTTVNGDGREGNGKRNSHVFMKRVRTLSIGWAVEFYGNCNSTAHKIASHGYVKITCLGFIN
jgi:hypothetical protein